jgi:hypothetical protein
MSLLQIHLPNDNQLFPRQLDMQLGNQDSPDGKWAIKRIERHVRSKTNAKFQVKWKLGDVTWMPYYQVQHLDALEAYLKLQGVGKIQDLPAGAVSSNSQAPSLLKPSQYWNIILHTRTSTQDHSCRLNSHCPHI